MPAHDPNLRLGDSCTSFYNSASGRGTIGGFMPMLLARHRTSFQLWSHQDLVLSQSLEHHGSRKWSRLLSIAPFRFRFLMSPVTAKPIFCKNGYVRSNAWFIGWIPIAPENFHFLYGVSKEEAEVQPNERPAMFELCQAVSASSMHV